MRHILRVSATFILLYLLAAAAGASAESLQWIPEGEREQLDLSQPVLKTLDGASTTLAELDARVLLVNFWATWCGPCRKEMPDLENLQKALADEGLAVVALSDDEPEAVRDYLDKSPFEFRFLLDAEADLYQRMGFPGGVLPASMIIDPRGRVALTHVGAYDWDAPEVVEALREMARR